MKYDAIVIGAGNGGLVSALTLQKNGKNVLLLEKAGVPGGVASSFKRGIFEFDTSLQQLIGYGNIQNPGPVQNLFQRLGVSSKISFKDIDQSFLLFNKETKESYTFPLGIENFIEQMEIYVNGSKDSFITFFGLAEEMRDALSYLNEIKEWNIEDLYQKYPNFVQLSPCSIQEVLEKIEMPRKAIDLFTSFAFFLGSSPMNFHFVSFALQIDSYLRYKPCIPLLTSHEISVVLEQEFKNLGGVVRYYTSVDEIFVEDNQVTGVRFGEESIFSNHVIANLNPITVYGKMIQKEKVPKEAFQLQNSRTLGAKSFSVYLGLNKSKDELGLNRYLYVLLNSFDMKKEQKRMQSCIHGNVLATVVNQGVSSASCEGTTEIILTSYFYGNDFDKTISLSNYFSFKEKIARTLISSFEEGTGISIQDCIEEIEVATPVTFARYTGHPDGVTHGFASKGYDQFVSRLFSEKEECFFKGLHFCGGSSTFLSGYGNTYLNGEWEALKVIEECES